MILKSMESLQSQILFPVKELKVDTNVFMPRVWEWLLEADTGQKSEQRQRT